MATLIVFITILRCVTLSKLRSWSRERKDSQEEPITMRVPMETLIKITLLPHTEVGLYSPPRAYEAALTTASNLKSSHIWNFSS